jgi:cell division inhibitor SepF
MASMWRRAMLYLGLGPDEEYDDYEVDDPSAPARQPPPAGRYPPARDEPSDVQVTGSVRTLTPQPLEPAGSGAAVRPRTGVVRPIPATPNAKPHVVSPTTFNDAQEIADKFKGNTPVIVNLQDVDGDLRRRLIDFASGLCYGLGGTMERVASQVYLLTPSNVEISAEERRRLHERGLYD